MNALKRYMRQGYLLLLLLTLGIGNVANAQSFTVEYKDAPIKTILKEVTRETGYTFVYSDVVKELNNRVSISYSGRKENITPLLTRLFAGTNIGWKQIEKQVALFNKESSSPRGDRKALQGVINDEYGDPLPGVTICNQTTGQLSMSGANGGYTINAKAGDIVIYSLLGMSEYIHLVDQRGSVDIGLKPEAIHLDNLVVTGYQSISKERATGSFDIVGAELLDKPSTSLEQSLIGNMPGIQVVNKAYRGREEGFLIRGLTSLGANSNPLIIVDGFAIEGSISSLNPNDIASITVLKDASAASIWGARSANGVIVVTTKNPQKSDAGKINVEFNAFVKVGGKMDVDYIRPLATSAETIEYEKQGFDSNFFTRGLPLANNYSPAIYDDYYGSYSSAVLAMNEDRLGFLDGSLTDRLNYLSSVDNRDQIRKYLLNNPVTQQYNLTISGVQERMSNTFTMMYDSDLMPFKGDERDRYTLNYRTKIDLFKWLEVSVATMFQHTSGTNSGITYEELATISPYDMLMGSGDEYLHVPRDIYLPIVDRFITQQGVEFPYSNWNYNPVQEVRERDMRNKTDYGRIQAGLKFKLLPGLSYDAKLQYEFMNGANQSLYSEDSYQVRFNVNHSTTWDGVPTTPTVSNLPTGMAISRGDYQMGAWNIRNQLNWDTTIGSKGSLSIIGGTEVSQRVYQTTDGPLYYGYSDELLSVTAPPNGIYSPSTPMFNMFGGLTAAASFPVDRRSYSVDKYFSVYANASYTYDNRVTVSGSVRSDASNLISSDPSIRYSPFWSVGAMWNLKRESFLRDLDIVDRMVVRATYGYNGNVDKSTSVTPLISIWGQDSNTATGFGVISNYGNPNLRWERTGTFNLGVDYSLLNNRLYGKVDFYNKQGRDLISTVAIANVYGSDTQKINAVSMYNRGVELTLGSQLQTGELIWNGNLSFAYNKNKITDLFKDRNTLANRIYGPGSGWQYAEGHDANTLWVFNYGGMQEIGGVSQPVIVDYNGENPRGMTAGNTSFDSHDYLVDGGTYIAPCIVGLNSFFKYRDFSFSFIISGYFGHKFMRKGFNYPLMSAGKADVNKYYSEVKASDGSDFIPIPAAGDAYPSQVSGYHPFISYLAINAGNIRFQEVNLTYQVPKRVTDKIGIGALSIYGQINDLGVILFNKYKQDPLYPMGGYRPTTSYTFGAKINF